MVSKFFRISISFLIVFIVFLLIWFTFIVSNISDELQTSVEKHDNKLILNHIKKFTKLIERKSAYDSIKLSTSLQKNKILRSICNARLEGLVSEEVPYVYLLWLDDKGRFRYLCDGSSQKSHFFQKFDPGDIKKWISIYQGKIPKIIDQSRYNGLWKSMLVPIVKNGRTEAMLVADYSTKFAKSVGKLISPLKVFINLIFLIISLLIILVIAEIIQIYQIRKKSYLDPLTKIYNRTFLNNLISKIPVSNCHIIMIDLDYFKQINDLYGHLIGDEALKHVVAIIKKCIDKKDYLVRFGGEEFILLAKISKGRQEPIVLAENIRKNLEKNPLKTKDFGDIIVRASIGVHDTTKEEKDFQTAIKKADIALYNAKKSGRNCVKVVDNLIMKDELGYSFSYIKNLIQNESVICHYQPIFSNTKGKIIKYEVLTRLKDKNDKLIFPNYFLPTIWKTNVYHQLTKQILEKSINIFKNRSEKFSINLSLQDILNEDILSIIEDMAKKEPDTVKKMGIEILEYDRFDDVKRLSAIMSRLKEYGISIILDDFGSGHANFAIVERLEFDEIKIDGSIVEHINTNPKSKALLETLAGFAKKIGIKTTVEYVSSKEIYESVSKIPFTYLQGFYIGKPKELD